jgi:DNA mismatch repair protein MutS
MIESGYSKELDEVRNRIAANIDIIPTFTEKYRLLTGKKSLKVFDKKLLGTFIEINVAEGPISHPNFQFLSQSEGKIRYKTTELSLIRKGQTKDEETEILLEFQIYEQLRMEILERMNDIRNSAKVISELDLLQSMSILAREEGFVRPILTPR